MSEHTTRRQFLRTAALTTAAAMLPSELSAQNAGTDISKELANSKYGFEYSPSGKGKDFKTFDPDFLKGKPYILITGRNECTYCTKIGANLTAIRKKVGNDIPVVVVNIVPETDKEDVEEYTGIYKEPMGDPKKAIFTRDGTKAKDYKDANGFILFPKSWQEAQSFQRNIGARFNSADPSHQSHGLYISVVGKDGKCVDSKFGAKSAEDGGADSNVVDTVVGLVGKATGRGRR